MAGALQSDTFARIESRDGVPDTGVSRKRDGARANFAGDPFDQDGVPIAVAKWADARAEVCNRFRDYRLAAKLPPLDSALPLFASYYNAREIPVSADTRDLIPDVAAPTLRRWLKAFERGGWRGLLPKYGNRLGRGIIEITPGMADFVVAMLAHQPHARAPYILAGMRARFSQVPSLSVLQSFVKRWKQEHASTFERLRNPDRWKGKYAVRLGDMSAARTGNVWEIDGTKADVTCTDGRFHLNVIIHIPTRSIVLMLSRTASAENTAMTLRKAIPVLGVPDRIISDWGSEYLNQRIERAMARLEITWSKVAEPYAGWLKPFVESLNRTIGMFLETLPGFSGHSVAQASEIRSQHSFEDRRGIGRDPVKLYGIELSSAELQDVLDRWVKFVYAQQPHSGLQGATPAQAFANADARGEIRRVAEERALDLLLAEDGVAAVGTKGIQVAGALFWSDELIPYVGMRIQYVRTRDAGRLAIYSANAAPRFICVAVNTELAGQDLQVIAIAAKQLQKRHVAADLAAVRANVREHRPENLWREILDNAEARAATALHADASNVTAMPYRNAALDAAGEALKALTTAPTIEPHDEETLREGDEALALIGERRHAREIMLDDDELDALWCAIRRAPRALSLREQRFLAHFGNTPAQWADGYETTNEYESMRWLERRTA